MTRTGNDEEEEKQEEAPFEGQPDDSEYEDARESNAQLESSENLGISDDGDLARDAATTGDEEAALGEGSSDNEETKGRKFLPADAPWKDRMWEVFTTFWPLGLIAFGGPQAHVAILRDHLVVKRQWLDEDSFMELFAIGQGLPGPTSTQLVTSVALARAGPLGGLLAFALWQVPGLVVLTICGTLIASFLDPNNPPWWLVGLPPAAIALVFPAFYSFALKLDTLGVVLALFSCLVAILLNNDARIPSTSSQYVFPAVMVIGACVTLIDSKRSKPFCNYSSPNKGWNRDTDETMKRIGIPMWCGAVFFVTWALVLVFSILLVGVWGVKNVYLQIFQSMYLTGSLIFGGGQVVLPMLQDLVVPAWMTKSQFLQGLGLTQSMPGPLFNFSAYLGAVYKGVPGALVAFIGLFGPGLILIYAMVPFWARLRHVQVFRAILHGLNATAIGLVGAACVTLWESAIINAADSMVFCVALTLDVVFHVPAPLVVLAGGIVGAILHPDALNLGQQPYCIDQGYAYSNTTDL